jgi:hypothetical protein
MCGHAAPIEETGIRERINAGANRAMRRVSPARWRSHSAISVVVSPARKPVPPETTIVSKRGALFSVCCAWNVIPERETKVFAPALMITVS